MPTRAEIVSAAREWIGTPFKHQGRLNGVGCDCAGLLVGVAAELKIPHTDYFGYGQMPIPEIMGKILSENLDQIPKSDIKPGDILWFKLEVNPQHLAIVTDKGMIHAASTYRRNKENGRVVEHKLDDKWRRRIFRAYRIRGVID